MAPGLQIHGEEAVESAGDLEVDLEAVMEHPSRERSSILVVLAVAASLLVGVEAFAVDLMPGDVLVSGTTAGPSGIFRVDSVPELVLERFYAAYAFDSDGSLIANDAGFDILRVDLSTGNETPIPMAAIPLLAGAADLVVADGIAYGVDDSASIEGVVRVDLTTGAQEIVASKGSLINPQGCAVGPDGMIYVADPGRFGFFEGKVVRIDPDTYDPLDNAFNQDVIVANRTGPTDIAFEASGTLLVTDSSVIVRFDTDGSALGQVGGSFLPMILHDIEIDSEGNAVVAGSDLFQPSNALVSRVSPGGITTVLTTQLIAPRNLAIVPAPEPDAALLAIGCVGSLLVCQRAKKRIAS